MTQGVVAHLLDITPARLGQIERGVGHEADPELMDRLRGVLRSIGRGHAQGYSPFQIAS
jgi:hypothetical protein